MAQSAGLEERMEVVCLLVDRGHGRRVKIPRTQNPRTGHPGSLKECVEVVYLVWDRAALEKDQNPHAKSAHGALGSTRL